MRARAGDSGAAGDRARGDASGSTALRPATIFACARGGGDAKTHAQYAIDVRARRRRSRRVSQQC